MNQPDRGDRALIANEFHQWRGSGNIVL